MGYKVTYDRTIFFNPANKYCIIIVKTSDKSIPEDARSKGYFKDHLIRFTAVGYELPRTDAVDMELDGEWINGKYGTQLQVEQWREIVPQTTAGIQGYLSSGLLKGIGEKTAEAIVARFGISTLDILENHPERLLEIKGITTDKLEEIKASYAESRMLRDIMTLLSPFKVTPKTALKIYQHFGPGSVDILRKSPFELCQISGFGFRKVDAIVRKTNNNLHDPTRIRGALFCALEDARNKQGHLFMESSELIKESQILLNDKLPVAQLRVQPAETEDVLQQMILNGAVVSNRGNIYIPKVFDMEDTTARNIASLLLEPAESCDIAQPLEQVKEQLNIVLSRKQEEAVYMTFRHALSVLTGPPGAGKTTVLKTVLAVFRRIFPKGKISLMAPTGRASRRMAESTGFSEARTLHSRLGLTGEEDGAYRRPEEMLDADLIIIDEFSMVDMWLAKQLFSRIHPGTRVLLVGDADQLPSVGAGNVFRELINSGFLPVTVLDEIFRQSKDSFIPYNARLINAGETKLYYGNEFLMLPSGTQEETARMICELYCREIAERGIENVQILSPFRSEGDASSKHLNETIREQVNPFRSAEEEIKFGSKTFRVGDRIMQTKNTDAVSNGDLGFITGFKNTPEGMRILLNFGEGRNLEYTMENMTNVELSYATTIHKAMGSEYEVVLIPIIKAHAVMLYRNLLYTAVTRAKKKVILVGQKGILFMAIHKNEISARNTMLGQRIGLYYKAFAKASGKPIPEINKELKNAG